MNAQPKATAAPAPKFGRGQRVLLTSRKRPSIEVTVRRYTSDDPHGAYTVTVDEGLVAGLRLWADESQLQVRPS